jgi:hypothetical protein
MAKEKGLGLVGDPAAPGSEFEAWAGRSGWVVRGSRSALVWPWDSSLPEPSVTREPVWESPLGPWSYPGPLVLLREWG